MRVAMYYNNKDVRLEQLPRPQLGPGDVLLEVQASGICGSDLLEWYRVPRAPLVLGHEIAGVVAECGAQVEGFAPGDRVVATHHVPCMSCADCLRGRHTLCKLLRSTHFDPGGFAEFLRLTPVHVERGLFRLPDEVSFEQGSFVEPLGCVLRGLRKAGLGASDAVLVVGSGISGLLYLQAARALGAGLLAAVDRLPSRLELAARCGAALTLQPDQPVLERLRQANSGRLADLVVVTAAASAAARLALSAVAPGGTVVLFAPIEQGQSLPVPVNELFFRDGVTLTSSYAAAPADLLQAIELLRWRRVEVDPLITHRLPLADTGEGFRLMCDGSDSLKVIIEPQR